MKAKLALSVRVAETTDKLSLSMPFADLAALARELGYEGLCMRACAGGVQTSRPSLEHMRAVVEDAGLVVTMVTADFDVPLNNEQGPSSLRDIGPSLDVADALGADLVRVALKSPADIEHARRAADTAAARGIRLAHQCHTRSLFEEVEASLQVLAAIDRESFGLIYEPANLMLCGQPYGPETLARFAPHLMNVYVQNHALDPEGPQVIETWSLGPRRFHHISIWEGGGVDFQQVRDGLAAIDYRGFVTVHQAYAHLMDAPTAARRSADYLRRLLV